MFDGTDAGYFHGGGRGYHWMWDSRCFNYGARCCTAMLGGSWLFLHLACGAASQLPQTMCPPSPIF